jgi:hypothetical protein
MFPVATPPFAGIRAIADAKVHEVHTRHVFAALRTTIV